MLPRAAQSATWEPVRELFPADWKTAKERCRVDDIWKAYDRAKSRSTKPDTKSSTLRAELERLSGHDPVLKLLLRIEARPTAKDYIQSQLADLPDEMDDEENRSSTCLSNFTQREETTMAQTAFTVTPPSPTPPTKCRSPGPRRPIRPISPRTPTRTRPTTTSSTPIRRPTSMTALRDRSWFAANTAALASGTGATAGGTEGSYPGAANGVVPASTSVAHEGAGTEVVSTATSTNPGPNGQLQMGVGLGAYTATPNASQASYLTGTAGSPRRPRRRRAARATCPARAPRC